MIFPIFYQIGLDLSKTRKSWQILARMIRSRIRIVVGFVEPILISWSEKCELKLMLLLKKRAICPQDFFILREKCPNTKFFPVRFFLHSD